MMRIRFQFHPETAVQGAAYLLQRLGGGVDRVKLMKLLYLADREHFLKHGYPITGDMQHALPYGPVPTCTFSLLSGQDFENDYVERFVVQQGCQYRLVADRPDMTCLSESAVAVLEEVLSRFGSMQTWALVKATQALPEYCECAIPNSSAPIPYEVILRHYGGEDRYRHGRAVIDESVSGHMLCPFPWSEPDL